MNDTGSRTGRSRQRQRLWAFFSLSGLVILIAALQTFDLVDIGLGPAPTEKPQGASADPAIWRPVFEEHFDRNAPLGEFLQVYGDRFGAYPYPWTDTSRTIRSDPGYYDPGRTLSVSDGVMDAWLHYDHELKRYLVAAPYPKLPQMRYGRFAVRLRAPVARGYRVAVMLWPDSDRHPEDGEINMPEGALNGKQFFAYAHFAQPADTPGPIQDAFPTGVNGDQWHVYETVWSPGTVEFFVDGSSIGASTHAVPDQPMHWVLQFETAITPDPPATDIEAHVQVDWLQAWAWAEAATSTPPTPGR